MEIKLLIKDKKGNFKKKAFRPKFISARQLKETAELVKMFDDEETEVAEIIRSGKLEEYLVDIYGNQFTTEELLEGYPANDFWNKALGDMSNVINGVYEITKN